MKNHHPPKLALRFFRWYCRPDRVEELQGDLEEFFHQRLDAGEKLWKAKFYFWWNVLRCYRSYATSKTQNSNIMYSLFKSYFKLAMRHSWKNKWSVLINILGLGIALSMCIFVYSLYAFNIEFDCFHENTEGIYRIHSMTFENGQQRRNEISPIALEDKLRNEISGIEKVSTYDNRGMTVKKGTDYFHERAAVISDDFFEMFRMPLWYGSYAGFGDQPLVYLSKPTAIKYFGNEVALGEKLTLYVTNEKKYEVIVGGVFQRIPLNSSFDFNILICQNDFLKIRDIDMNDWSNSLYVSHYIKADPTQIENITSNINQYVPFQDEEREDLKISQYELVPFLSPLIADDIIWMGNTNGRLRPVIHIVFTTLVSMVFLIACFNLANTSMAMIANRLKEIGIRKTLGSESRQILIQFLLEMAIVSFFAFIIAISMVNFTFDSIMGLFGETFLVRDIDLTGVILFIIGFLVFTTLVAGLLPALYAWKFQPVAIMRKSVKLKGVNWLNKSLSIAQFGFSIAVLSAGITFSQNSEFLSKLRLGYANEGIIDLVIGDVKYYGPMKQEVDQLPGVVTAGAKNHFGNNGRFSQTASLVIDTSSYDLRLYEVGSNYLDLMEVTVTNGRGFIDGSEADKDNSVLVSQEFVRRYFDGNDPLNSVIKINGERLTIVGVVSDLIDDVYSDSELSPIAIKLEKEGELQHLIVKVNHGNLEEVEGKLKSIWSEQIDQPYHGRLQSDLSLGNAGSDTKNLQIIFVAMAILGGFLSIVGIFSLAKLNVARRLKEIGIRKVLGATIGELLITINRSFVFVLVIAMFVGSGLGYFISDLVLGMIYSRYVDVSALTSLVSGTFVVFCSLIIIMVAVHSAANSNPVVGLREE